MSRFYSETNRPKRLVQPKTNPIEPEYEERIDTKTGKKNLKKIGETDVYEKIQAAAEGVTLKEIIKRYNINPTESAIKLEEDSATIFDYTNQPQNLMEALEIANQAKNVFETASKEIKNKFNNNFTEFLASANNGTLKDVLNEFKPKEVETIKEETIKVAETPKTTETE